MFCLSTELLERDKSDLHIAVSIRCIYIQGGPFYYMHPNIFVGKPPAQKLFRTKQVTVLYHWPLPQGQPSRSFEGHNDFLNWKPLFLTQDSKKEDNFTLAMIFFNLLLWPPNTNHWIPLKKIDIDFKMTLKYASEGQNGQDYWDFCILSACYTLI